MQVDNLFTNKKPLWVFLNMKVNIEALNMLGVRLKRGRLNEKLQHLYKNLHMWFQNQDGTQGFGRPWQCCL
jgi:hypothetical protein